MITITLTAETIEELQKAAILALGLKPPLRPFAPEPVLEEPKRPVGRPRKVQPDPVPEPLVDGTILPFVEEPVVNGEAKDNAIALEKLKQETVAKLPDMFAAGKVNLMRAVLTKYGKGAKSFPEIEAKDFPEIAAALARGDGS